MTTMHTRQRTLSIQRRTGFQGSHEASLGLAQRERQGARHDIERDRQSEAVSLVVEAVAIFAMLASVVTVVCLAVGVFA